MTDQEYDFYEKCMEVRNEVLTEFAVAVRKNKGKTINDQEWEVVPLQTVQAAWSEFMRYGFVRNEKRIENIASIFMRNIMKIMANMELSGAFGPVPEDEFKDVGLTEDQMHQFWEFAHHYTDYGHRKLIELALLLWKETNIEKKLILCDRILNVVHPSSDLSEFFVRGGRRSLDILSEG